jgi:hypothetical protein
MATTPGLCTAAHIAPYVYSASRRYERLQAEGHPVGAGGVGENLTTTGIEWSLLPAGTRARVGDEVVLEYADTASPCATQRPNFSDGRFSRISIEIHPSDARMYARVIEEGSRSTERPDRAVADAARFARRWTSSSSTPSIGYPASRHCSCGACWRNSGSTSGFTTTVSC